MPTVVMRKYVSVEIAYQLMSIDINWLLFSSRKFMQSCGHGLQKKQSLTRYKWNIASSN